jgi:D-sedoheptulose 7-phosphate isomerase
MYTTLTRYWAGLAAIAQTMPLDAIAEAAELLLGCHQRGGTIFVFGNGGSAATAAHFACDLAKGTRSAEAGGMRVLSLVDNTPLLTAWANDASYSRVFAEQIALLVRPQDLVVAISASGNSPNVIDAVEAAHALGATTVGLTGWPGGRLRGLVDLAVPTPDVCIELVEDAHMAVAHSLCVALRERLAADSIERSVPLALELGR